MFNISFDFDENSHKVNNIVVFQKELPQKESTGIINGDLKLCDNTLLLSPDAVKKLNAHVGDRISINYWNVSSTETYPIISKAEVFTDGNDGNQLRRRNTISFRGDQHVMLSRFGTLFTFEEWKDRKGQTHNDVYKLVPVKEDDTDLDKINEEEDFFDSMKPEDLEDDATTLLEEGDDDFPF